MNRHFTTTWTASHSPFWSEWLKEFVDVPNVRGLEVGCFEGQSSIWFCENILTGPGSHIICVDADERPAFLANTQDLRDSGKIQHIIGKSFDVLRLARPPLAWHFDWMYIDANHGRVGCIQNLVLAWALLKQNGIMVIDDFEWQHDPNTPTHHFLWLYERELEVIHRDRRVAVRRVNLPFGDC